MKNRITNKYNHYEIDAYIILYLLSETLRRIGLIDRLFFLLLKRKREKSPNHCLSLKVKDHFLPELYIQGML